MSDQWMVTNKTEHFSTGKVLDSVSSLADLFKTEFTHRIFGRSVGVLGDKAITGLGAIGKSSTCATRPELQIQMHSGMGRDKTHPQRSPVLEGTMFESQLSDCRVITDCADCCLIGPGGVARMGNDHQ